MAKCEICGKDMAFGIQVSHSHRRSNRTWKPNIKRVRAIVNGSPKRIYAVSYTHLKNLNEGKCGCSARQVDPRLEILKKLID